MLPERVERVRRELLENTPYVAPADLVDEEYRAYRARLLEEAMPREPDDLELIAEPVGDDRERSRDHTGREALGVEVSCGQPDGGPTVTSGSIDLCRTY